MSAIVTMLIIIALSLVAIGVVWAVISNILKGTKEEISLGFEDLMENPLNVGENNSNEEEECTPQSDEITCGVWICGSRENNCGTIVDCGACASGTCGEGVCVGCTPVCDGKECGDDGCGSECPPGCEGSAECVEGNCITEISVDSGVIDLVWPPGVGLYFDSYDLPTEIGYIHYYVKFPGSAESECLLIYDYIFPSLPQVYNKSHIRLGASHSDIQPNDNYEIWETYVGCLG